MRRGALFVAVALSAVVVDHARAASSERAGGLADAFRRICVDGPNGLDADAARVAAFRNVVLERRGDDGAPARHVDWMVVGPDGPYEVDAAQYASRDGSLATCAVSVPEPGVVEGLRPALAKALGAEPTYVGKDGASAVWVLDGRSVTLSSSPSTRPGASARTVRATGR